jgi:hypothetical protein
MTITVKHSSKRQTLHDLYWFELIPFTVENIPVDTFIDNFKNSAIDFKFPTWDFLDTLKNNDIVRPDINELTQSDLQSLGYDPLSINFTVVSTFENIESFRIANRELFSNLGEEITKLCYQTNNSFIESVYDTNNIFLEHGLFNINPL